MRAEISRLHQRLGTTTLYVTHDQTEAITMAGRVAVMRDGTLQQLDTPTALYDEPVNLFVAGFIGSPAMNVVTARLSSAGGRVSASFGAGHRLVVPEAVLARRPAARSVVAAGGEVALGIRPEDIEDAEFVPGAGPDELLEVTVDLADDRPLRRRPRWTGAPVLHRPSLAPHLGADRPPGEAGRRRRTPPPLRPRFGSEPPLTPTLRACRRCW